MSEALETLALDAELFELEHQLGVLEPQLQRARAEARSEVADLQRVERGPTSWWLAVTGRKEERVAKERAEAEDAVQTLKVLGATARELGTRLAEVRERRHGRPDPVPALTALAGADPAALVLLDRHQRLRQAATDAREAWELFQRANAQLGKLTDVALTRRDRARREFDETRLEVCDDNLRDAAQLIDGITRSLEAAGLSGPDRLTEVRLGSGSVVLITIFALDRQKSSIDDQQAALTAFSESLRGPRAAIARKLLETLRDPASQA